MVIQSQFSKPWEPTTSTLMKLRSIDPIRRSTIGALIGNHPCIPFIILVSVSHKQIVLTVNAHLTL